MFSYVDRETPFPGMTDEQDSRLSANLAYVRRQGGWNQQTSSTASAADVCSGRAGRGHSDSELNGLLYSLSTSTRQDSCTRAVASS